MEIQELEQSLNVVIKDLVDGLNALADKVRDGASPEATADSIQEMAGIICKHWPDCFAKMTSKKSNY